MPSGASGVGALLALCGLVIAIAYQIAPGEPAWMEKIPSPPPADSKYEIHKFPGGDGTTTLMGRMYYPTTSGEDSTPNKKTPLIVLAHGLGLMQDASLDPFVSAFTQAGLAAFTFDYATFGYSEGWPRHQVKPEAHVADLKAALDYVRSFHLTEPLRDQIGLWGTSLGGGHVLRVAAEDYKVQVVVANVPHVKSGLESLLGTIQADPSNSLVALVKVAGALIKGVVTKMISGKTIYIPLHGLPGSAAMMQNPGDDEGYGGLITPEARQAGWTNLASVFSMVPTLMYRPYNRVQKIRAPTLLIPASDDTLCPAADAQEAAKRIRSSQVYLLEKKGHFDVYQDDTLQDVLKETVSYFQKHLLPKAE